MPSILWIIGHPQFQEAVGAQAIVQNLMEHEQVEFRIICDVNWDRGKEQSRWMNADHIVFHFPLFWYGMPGILKTYLDDMLQPGWAFGEGGHALQSKTLSASITTGAALSSYASGGNNDYELSQFMLPLQQTARFTGMRWRGVTATGSVPWDVAETRWHEHIQEVFERLL
jgi:putative NADPH-quinone reductase